MALRGIRLVAATLREGFFPRKLGHLTALRLII